VRLKSSWIGACGDAELEQALTGARTEVHAEAAIVIARIDGPEDLLAAQAACRGLTEA